MSKELIYLQDEHHKTKLTKEQEKLIIEFMEDKFNEKINTQEVNYYDRNRNVTSGN